MNTHPCVAPPGTDRPPQADPLRRLRHRLLREWLARQDGDRYGRLPRLAAIEAEALAWQTSAPLLVLPELLAEKLETVRRYARCPAPSRPIER